MSGQFHAPADLISGKKPTFPIEYGKDGSQNCSERFAGKKNLLLLPVIEPRFLGRPACWKFHSWYGKKNEGLLTALWRNWCTEIPSHISSWFDPQNKIPILQFCACSLCLLCLMGLFSLSRFGPMTGSESEWFGPRAFSAVELGLLFRQVCKTKLLP